MASVGSFNSKDWQAQMDLETLIAACKIRKDKQRMAAVKKIAKKRKAELADQIGDVSKFENENESNDTDKDGD